MPSPFAGMDPYLERPRVWHPFHTRLVVRLADAIAPQLPERYYVSVEERVYIELPGETEPTVELQEALTAVYDLGRYGRRIDYRQEPDPPLDPEDAAWADALLRSEGLRQG